MDYFIRPLTQEDEPFLWQMLYEAAHLVEEGNLTVQDAMNNPDLAKYVSNWGRKDDGGFVAILESSNQPILLHVKQLNYHNLNYNSAKSSKVG